MRRESASRALDAIGEAALNALRQATTHEDLEIRRRARRLVQSITNRLARETEVKAIALLVGKWHIKYSNQAVRTYTIDKTGKVHFDWYGLSS